MRPDDDFPPELPDYAARAMRRNVERRASPAVSAVPSGSAGEPTPTTFADQARESNAHWGAQMQKLDSDAVRDAWDAAHDAAISYANTRVFAEQRGNDRGVEFQYQQFVKRLDALLSAVAAAATAQTRDEIGERQGWPVQMSARDQADAERIAALMREDYDMVDVCFGGLADDPHWSVRCAWRKPEVRALAGGAPQGVSDERE